jgi:predicted SAM-dependent methyltransferase
MAETSKSRPRRESEGFFDKYVQGKVIDIGVGRIDTHDGSDPLTDWCDTWDKDNGNAELMESVPDNTYDLVYNSHLLQHLDRPELAIMNWMRITKPGGYLIMAVPHRDLYERQTKMPSKWVKDHKFFIMPDEETLPDTRSLKHLIEVGCRNFKYKIISIETNDTSNNKDRPEEHGNGEYQIEAIIQKL